MMEKVFNVNNLSKLFKDWKNWKEKIKKKKIETQSQSHREKRVGSRGGEKLEV